MKIREYKILIKYFFDKVISLVMLLILSPVFVLIGIILKMHKQDVFYLQKRFGYKGRYINVFKFTTMPKGSEKLGMITTVNDDRPFKFGKFLRKTSLNELPQLINVFIGEMSFVGPRPLVQIDEYLSKEQIISFYRMRPGITGLSSVYYHNEDEVLAQVSDPYKYYKDVIMKKKIAFEKEYYERWSLYLDVKILINTFFKVVFR
tara:strand:- start:57 stop:668 length:612 start_codon:yes stop_codon:yes gene_type:complete